MNEQNNKHMKVLRKIHGRRRAVSFAGLLYSSQSLISTPDLDGKLVELTVNIEDIRTLDAKIKDGKSLGKVEFVSRGLFTRKISLDEYRKFRIKARKELSRLDQMRFITTDTYVSIARQYKNVKAIRKTRKLDTEE